MATARALAAGTLADDFRGNEQIEDSELVVTSARADNLRAWLPAIDDGGTTTVAAGYAVRVVANSTGDIEIVDVFGRRVATVPAGSSIVFTAAGDLLSPVWYATPVSAATSIGVALETGSVTAVLGAVCPGASATALWFPVQKLDGTIGYVAMWS